MEKNTQAFSFFQDIFTQFNSLKIPIIPNVEKYYANITKDKTSYSQLISDIKTLKIPNDVVSFDIILVIKYKVPTQTFGSKNGIAYLKFYLDGIKTINNNWCMSIKKSSSILNILFSINKDGQIQYSSDFDFELKYDTRYI
jgi:hypothetical protein